MINLVNTASHPLSAPGAVETDVHINWALLIERRPAMLATLDYPDHAYLLLPEVNRLITTAKDLQTRTAITLMWYTGVRIGELLALRVEDLRIESAQYAFVAIKRTLKKRGKIIPRVIEIHDPACIDLISQYLVSYRLRQRDCLFPGKQSNSKSISPSTLFRRIEKLADQDSFPIKVTPHTLRHSFAINALLHGRPIKTIQAWLGHADPRSTEVYAKLLSGDVGFQMAGIQYR